MSQPQIDSLTPEQEALIPVYREKWRTIALSTKRIDRRKACEAVISAHAVLCEFGILPPSSVEEKLQVFFFDSPYAALSKLSSQENHLLYPRFFWKQLARLINEEVWEVLLTEVKRGSTPQESQLTYQEIQLIRQLVYQLYHPASEQLAQLWLQLRISLASQLEKQLVLKDVLKDYWFLVEEGVAFASCFDFCISVLKYAHERKAWEALLALTKDCGFIFYLGNTWLVCERPIQLSFNSAGRLHAEGEPAVQYADGYSLYSYQGVNLPEKYSKRHPNQWQAQWLLEEDNAELRRVLIQGIGYEQICQELQAIELDSWQEYALIGIDSDIDVEPVYLLKMTCPSTGKIHVLRVSPEVNSAREAIRWVNWGISPEDFSVQT